MSGNIRYRPPAFTPIGLSPTGWADGYWFSSFSGMVGRPAAAIDLGYSSSLTTQRIIVRTEDLEDESLHSGRPKATEAEVAYSAVHLLVNAADSGLPPLGDTYARRVIEMIDTVSQEHATWPTLGWYVNGEELSAKTWEYAGAWLAFSLVDARRGMIVVGHNVERQWLDLEDVQDARDFAFDLFSEHSTEELRSTGPPTSPLGFGSLALPGRHADQLALAGHSA